MKFKVTTNIKPNMFGRINGSVTVAGNDGDCPYSVEWLIDEIMELWYDDIKDPNILIDKRKYIIDELSKLNYNQGYSIADKNGRLAILVLRVADNTTFSDIMEEALDGI